jgi:hypothetical protein
VRKPQKEAAGQFKKVADLFEKVATAGEGQKSKMERR